MGHAAGECPVCNKVFSGGEDIVTCPSCGAPYHRACYQKTGRCLFEEKHGAGFEYPCGAAARHGAGGAPGQSNSGGVLCRQCNTVNEANHIFCESCGSPLRGGAPQPAAPFGGFGGHRAYPPPHGEGAEAIDGIPGEDWNAFIGPNAPLYLQRMSALESQSFSFFFSAFLFSPSYFAYRKMWGWAALSLGGTLLFMAPSLLWRSAGAGFNLIPALSPQVLGTLDTVSSYLALAMRLGFGVFALRLYKNHAKKHILALRRQTEGHGEYRTLLARAGGVSLGAALTAVALVFLLTAVFLSLGGPDFINALMDTFYPGL